MKKEKSLEEMSLETVKKDKHLRRLFDQWSTFGEYHEPVLLDNCQSYKKSKGSEQEGWWIMLRCLYYEGSGWELSLWKYQHLVDNDHNIPEGPVSLFKVVCSGWQIGYMTEQLWSASQHVRLKKFDGQNVAWDYRDAYNWLEKICREGHMLISAAPPLEHKLHYIDKGGNDDVEV